jgi:hypothetical protein
MAFEHRVQELTQRFELFRTTLRPEEFAPLSASLDAILRARQEGLNALAELLADRGDSKRADACESKLDELARSTLERFQNLLQNMKEPSANLQAFRDITSSEEQRFWEKLRYLRAGHARDAQLGRFHDLEWFCAIMRVRWTQLSDTEKDLLQKERYYAAQLRETVKKAFEEAAPDSVTAVRDGLNVLTAPERAKKYINEKYKEVLRSLATRAGGDPARIDALIKFLEEKRGNVVQAAQHAGLDPATTGKVIDALCKPGGALASLAFDALSLAYNPLGGIAKTVVKVAQTLQPVAQSVVDARVGEMRTMMGGRQTVILTFSTTRREAREYVEKNGYDQAKALFEDTRSRFEAWKASQNGALQTDAESLWKRAEEANRYFLEQMEKVHVAFVSEFRGILIDPVSDRTVDVLADRPFYEEFADGIKRLDMDQQLQKIYAGMYEMKGNIDRAFGEMTTFNEMPLESQAMIQEIVMRFEREVKEPYTREMQQALATLEAAKGKQPATVAESARKAAMELARQAAAA